MINNCKYLIGIYTHTGNLNDKININNKVTVSYVKT